MPLSGNRLVYGWKGEIIGPASGDLFGKALQVQFPQNVFPIYLPVDAIARELVRVMR